jgi:hypothetical protein
MKEKIQLRTYRRIFEYKVIYSIGDMSFEEMLNKLGDEGWEVISVNSRCESLTGHIVAKREGVR